MLLPILLLVLGQRYSEMMQPPVLQHIQSVSEQPALVAVYEDLLSIATEPQIELPDVAERKRLAQQAVSIAATTDQAGNDGVDQEIDPVIVMRTETTMLITTSAPTSPTPTCTTDTCVTKEDVHNDPTVMIEVPNSSASADTIATHSSLPIDTLSCDCNLPADELESLDCLDRICPSAGEK